MSKKHFEALARAIRASDRDLPAKMFAANIIIRIAEADNPQFSRSRFLTACGLEAQCGLQCA